jgi:hypothetical protein
MRKVQIVYYMFLYAHFFFILITYLVHMTFHKENPTRSEVNSIQHHVIKFCQVGVFSLDTQVSSTNMNATTQMKYFYKGL